MPRLTVQPLLAALETALGVPARTLASAGAEIRRAALYALGAQQEADGVAAFAVEGRRYLATRYGRGHGAIVLFGPFRHPEDPPCDAPLLDAPAVARARRALAQAAEGLSQVMTAERKRLELAAQVELIDSAAIAITGELELSSVLHRIVDLARDVAGARYAALGVINERGEIVSLIASGMSEEEQARVPHIPHGRGILGRLLREGKTIRLRDLRTNPDAYGFPEGHPEMRSFLGVPITSRGRVLGNLYLTEKRFARDFTDEDVRLVELLARYAGVAIENAGLYQRAEAQQARLQAIIDQLPEAVLLVEPNPERVTLANTQAAHLLGWEIRPPLSLEEFLAANPRFQVDDTPMNPDDIPVVRALRYGETSRREIRMVRSDGRVITALVNAAPVRDAGKITAAIAVFQDISAIKDAEQLKDDFLSLISHELRTPMTTIQGGALLLLQNGADLDEQTRHEILTDIANESRRLAGLVENMVQLANIRAGRFGMDSEPVHLRTLLQRAIDAMQEQEPKHPFVLDVERDLLALGDPGRLDQVVRNLLQNAIKYAPAGTPIEVSAARGENGTVIVSVRDHGPGIDEEDLPFVFERFQRGKQAVLRNTAGMGLGLYLSKHLIEAHGGQIWIERPPDGGTSIHFSVPAITDDL